MEFAFIFVAGFRKYLKRIYIEKALAVQCHTGEHSVVKRLLHHICILYIRTDFQHAACKENKTDRSAGLCVGSIVRKIIIKGKGLSHVCTTDAAGDIELFLNHIVPESTAGIKQAVIFCQSGDIRHAGVEINGAHGMADRLVLLSYREMGLIVGIAQSVRVLFYFFRMLFVKIVWLCSAFIDKIFCKF